ncbi:MAG: flavin reductase family protein [Bacteroidia bacterium]|nr:flavin reductase family protein [Bacteroidia bacterium]
MNDSPDILHLDPTELSIKHISGILTGAVGPRPIAFASTIDSDGNPNLSPFSFFNAFGTNPPLLVFSPSRRGRDNTTKHTYQNIREIPEVVINVVNYGMVQQTSLASSEYAKGTNEFMKAGFTMEKSDLVRPWRVKESPVQFECTVLQVIETGDQAGAGNLVICRIVRIHMYKNILDGNNRIDPHKIDLVGRLGANFYCRASGDAVFEVKKPLDEPGIGVDSLPEQVRLSRILTGNDLGKLGNLKSFPTLEEIERMNTSDEIKAIYSENIAKEAQLDAIHRLAKEKTDSDEIYEALLILMTYNL